MLEIREHVLKYLKTLKEVTYHYNADESDDIETAKLETEKSTYDFYNGWKRFDLVDEMSDVHYKNIEYFVKQKMYSMTYQ